MDLTNPSLDRDLTDVWSVFLVKSSVIGSFRSYAGLKQDDFYKMATEEASAARLELLPPDLNKELPRKFAEMMPVFAGEFPRLLRETTLVMVVAAFESFLMDSLRTILTVQPQLLYVELNKKKRKKLTNPKSVTVEKLNKKMEQLASYSIEKKFDFVRSICPDFDNKHLQTESVIEIFETRHIIVHNGGVVSRRYIKKVPKTVFAVGDERLIEDKYLFDSHRTINSAAVVFYGLFLKEFCGVTLPEGRPA